tara:strand:+ start:59 stop:253 length:195 start_codon:yes stop_codon:yes gene_type:complete
MDEVCQMKIAAVIVLLEQAHSAVQAKRLDVNDDGSISPSELLAIERVLDGGSTTLRGCVRIAQH